MIIRSIFFLCVFLLGACASVEPLKSGPAENLKLGKSAVDFYDGTKKITYIEDVYLVLAVTQEASESVYNGLWDSSKELSELHAKELSKIGVRAQSIHDSLTDTEASAFNKMQEKMYKRYVAQEDKTTFDLDPAYRELMLKKGFDYLFWITGPEYVLHMHALGLDPFSMSSTTFWIYDLKRNTPIWNGVISALEKISIGEQTGKAFIEKNNLSGLKEQIKLLTRNRYDTNVGSTNYSDSMGQLIGLEQKQE